MTHKILNVLFISILHSESRFRYVFPLESSVVSVFLLCETCPSCLLPKWVGILKMTVYWNYNCDISSQNVLLEDNREKRIMMFTKIYPLILESKSLNF